MWRELIEDRERLKDYAAAVQNIFAAVQSVAVVFGIIVGGIWVLAVHQKLEAELRIQTAEMELGRRGLQLTIEGHQEPSPDPEMKRILVTVTAENKGNGVIVVHFTDRKKAPPITVARLGFLRGENVPSSLDDAIHPHIMVGPRVEDTILENVIQPRELVNYTAVAAVPDAGTYLLVFDAPVDEQIPGQKPNAALSHWTVSNYVFVR